MNRACAILFPIAFVLVGCATESVRYADRTITAEMIQERVGGNHQRVNALRGSGTISVETSEIAQSGSFDLMLRKPDSLLVKIEGPFGIDVGSAMVTRERFSFYYSFQNRLLEGPTNPENLSKVFHVPIDFDDVLNLFLGGFFLSEDRGNPSTFSIEEEKFVLTYDGLAGTRRYWVDPQTMQIVRIQHLDAGGKLALEQIFSKFQTVDSVSIPQYVRVTMLKDRRRISIAYSDLAVNPPDLKFSFEVPTNASRARLQ